MSPIKEIDDQSFTIECNCTVGKFSHFYWLIRERTPFCLLCYTEPKSKVPWKVNVTVTFKVFEEDGTLKHTGTVDGSMNESCGGVSMDKIILGIKCPLSYCHRNKYTYECLVTITSFEYPPPLHDFRLSDVHNDTALNVVGRKLYINKSFLSKFSSFFNAMFNSDFKEKTTGEYSIEVVSFYEFEMFLQVMYGFDDIYDSSIKYLLALADRFDTSLVMSKCEKFLLENSDSSAAKKLEYAELYSLDNVKETVLAKITRSDIIDIVSDDTKLSEATLKRLLRISLSLPPNNFYTLGVKLLPK